MKTVYYIGTEDKGFATVGDVMAELHRRSLERARTRQECPHNEVPIPGYERCYCDTCTFNRSLLPLTQTR